MIYRKFQDIQLSGLGLGMMRLPVLGGNDGRWMKPQQQK